MKNLAIIPARSGSKGLPDKNILKINGKPLIQFTITAAMESGCFDEIMVSTDSEKYADIAKRCGANVPFLRSNETSGDNAGSWDVVREVLTNYSREGKEFDYVTLLQPTSPLRNSDDIKGIFELMRKAEANNAVTVTEVDHPVQWCFKLPDNGSMEEMAKSPYSYMRRQELEKHYRENGAIYVVDAKKIMDSSYNFYSDGCFGYIMPRERSIDIDTEMDLIMVKATMELLSIEREMLYNV